MESLVNKEAVNLDLLKGAFYSMEPMPHDRPRENNRVVAALFQSIAGLLEIRRENPHRIKAYRRGAAELLRLEEDVADVAQRGALQGIPGIGRDLAAKVVEFLRTGTIQAHEALNTPLPSEVADWTNLPGLSDMLVQHLYFKLGIRTLPDLDKLVRSHLLRTLPGISVCEEDLLAAIEARTAEAKDKN
ncbi:MAG: histidinol-phosphatase [Nitrospiraceae bacterium]